jgi:hypothetical protein
MENQISLFHISKMVLEKPDKEYGWIYICPTCKSFVCGGSSCLECGQDLEWPVIRANKVFK